MDIIIQILWVLIPWLVIYVVIKVIVRMRAVDLLNRFRKDNLLLISSNANFFGLESAGVKQIKGNGMLLLTKNTLYFKRLLPKKMIEIPVANIEQIEEVRSHLGKSKGSKLLKIYFKNDKLNTLDSCAWLVNNREKWEKRIEELLN